LEFLLLIKRKKKKENIIFTILLKEKEKRERGEEYFATSLQNTAEILFVADATNRGKERTLYSMAVKWKRREPITAQM